MKNKWISIVLLWPILASHSYGQEVGCEAAKARFLSFDAKCISRIASNNCVNLDITDSYDFEGKEFVFKWDMGDGTILEGLNINHCYNNPGLYVAKLSLEDPITKAVIQEEAEIDVVIKGSFGLTMNPLEDVRTDIEENASFTLDYPDSAYQIKYTYWDFGDGNFSCEGSPNYSYSKTGTYYRSLLVRLESSIDQVLLCASDSVTVKLADPTAGLLTDAIAQIEIDSRFLEDKPTYFLMKKTGDTYKEVEGQDELTGNATYRIITYRGNLIYDSEDVIVPDGADLKAVQTVISEKTMQLAEGSPSSLQAMFFELDQNELSRKIKKILDDNVELLQNLPMMDVEVGVYTTSGGSYNKGVALSIKRAQLIKQYMVDEGVKADRIKVSSPQTARSLINSCLTGSNCDYVDELLNRRADFKFKMGR
ncbi:Outer membrane protein OmpA [Ekhidna lutea]|uniref:Outer membrane protein OmpA n=1 Tax=Ekhidna lutea TaxID=447679 RepID=A0A239L0F2_EKHLU|nr:PKD domain-containing protein [Ekhidna lutea]SNT23790.1 Outer membrane protein OmpA [Ekhidna lutea]